MLEKFIRINLIDQGFEVSFSKDYYNDESLDIRITKNHKIIRQVVNLFEIKNSNLSEDVLIIRIISGMIERWNEEFEE